MADVYFVDDLFADQGSTDANVDAEFKRLAPPSADTPLNGALTQAKLRHDALMSGVSRFFTGRPCKHGHLTFRYSTSGSCIDCMRQNSERFVSSKGKGYRSQEAIRRRVERSGEQAAGQRSPRGRKAFDLVQSDHVGRWCIYTKDNAKVRARKLGIPFNISANYLRTLYVTHCPALGIELVYCNRIKQAFNSASLDRKIPALGYVEAMSR